MSMLSTASKSLRHVLRSLQPRIPSTSVRFSSMAVDSTDHLAILSLPLHYLRAVDPSNIDPSTLQRIDVPFDIVTGKPPLPQARDPSTTEMVDCSFDGVDFRIQWKDGLSSVYSAEWVEETLQQWSGKAVASQRVMCAGLTGEMLRSSPDLHMTFEHALTQQGMDTAVLTLHKYGIMLIKNTPIDDNASGAVAALASAFGGGSVKNSTNLVTHYSSDQADNAIVLPHGTDGPLRTMYGTIWSTSSTGQLEGSSMADSVYGNEALPLHTDLSYTNDPPGLLFFSMVQPATTGGESIYSDGFAAAERLRRINPEAFTMLAQTEHRFYCVDDSIGWHLQARGPVISLNAGGEITQIRHNDLDRLPALPPRPDMSEAEVNEFYEKLHAAHVAWDRILSQDDMRVVIKLEAGDTVVAANQRWMHGRYGFDVSPDGPPRVIMGCFTGQDELNSRFRMMGCESP